MAFSSSDISLRMEHLFVTPLFYLLAGFWGLFSHICFFFWTCAHYIKSKHHLHIKINIWSTWYHVPSIWGGKRNMGQWLSFSKYNDFVILQLTDWSLNYSAINMYSYNITGGMYWSFNCSKTMWYMSFTSILVCFLRSTSLFGFSKMTHDTILALSIAKKDNTACHHQHHCSSYTLG